VTVEALQYRLLSLVVTLAVVTHPVAAVQGVPRRVRLPITAALARVCVYSSRCVSVRQTRHVTLWQKQDRRFFYLNQLLIFI